jgi:hypothetical protein
MAWVKDNAGNRFLCPVDALIDPNSVSDEEKQSCVDDAARLTNPDSVPGEQRLRDTDWVQK